MTEPAAELKAITFDLDDTLWDNHGVMLKTEQGHYQWLLSALNEWRSKRDETALAIEQEAGLADYLAKRQALAKATPARRGDFTWLRLRALEAQLEESGLDRSAAILWAAAAMNEFHRLRVQVTPHPEAFELLEALGQRFHLAAITNGNIHLRRQPLAAYFPIAVAAGELFTPKPDPSAFLNVLERLNVAPECAMHVGDSWEEDVLPASRLGMHAVWIAGEADRELPSRVYRLSHVRELPALIARLENAPD
ncbi:MULTISPECIES: HAD family hydrolase [unclassified Halomonas]|uniref:HAD family hydrolase n=1 Tax=unclassified Halomonas TaxID=2609666 RepID=UPI002076B0BC|nr:MULTISPECIES: HAD family hydrolase [unclassified Halomonas]